MASELFYIYVRVRKADYAISRIVAIACSDTLTLQQFEEKCAETLGPGRLWNEEYFPHTQPSSLKKLGYTCGSCVDYSPYNSRIPHAQGFTF